MTDNRLQQVLGAAGVLNGPGVVRFYRDGDDPRPAIVVQRDFQGCRIMLRPVNEPEAWTCAWFDDAGSLVSVEKFCCGNTGLGADETDEFLTILLNQPLKEMTREQVDLAA